jgi:hypothetical protein
MKLRYLAPFALALLTGCGNNTFTVSKEYNGYNLHYWETKEIVGISLMHQDSTSELHDDRCISGLGKIVNGRIIMTEINSQNLPQNDPLCAYADSLGTIANRIHTTSK